MISVLSSVAYLISQIKFTTPTVADWKQRYPHAQAYCLVQKLEKRAKKSESQGYRMPLTDKASDLWVWWDWSTHFKESSVIEGSVFHKSTKTLIVTDLAENFELNWKR